MRKVTVSRMCERYAQTVLTFRITYVHLSFITLLSKIHVTIFPVNYIYNVDRGSSVGIATDYGLDGPGSNSGGDEIFRPSGPAHPASGIMGTGSFPEVKRGRGMLLTTHPLLVSRSWKSRAIPLPTLWATPSL